MKKEFTNDHLEDFLKQSADGFRMKPPDKVWQNLSKELNKRRRRFALGLSVLLLITSATGYFVIDNTSGEDASLQTKAQPNETASLRLSGANPDKQEPAQTATVSATADARPDRKAANAGRANTANPLRLVHSVYSGVSADGATSKNKPSSGATAADDPVVQEEFMPTVADSYTDFEVSAKAKSEAEPLVQTASVFPLSVESVINAYKARQHYKRWETQLYFTPSISYRKLAENKSYLRTLDPNAVPANYAAFHSSVNSNVTHKPDVGIELGFGAKYALSRNFKLRSGLQFNVNRYDVKAFSSTLSVATIALNNGPRIDSFNTVSRYSNIDGYKSDWLQNLYFQLSVPIGAEYLITGNNKVQIGVAGTVQPTYVLGDRAYLITTDYKSYTEVPWLIRRWNVNTALETFVTYQGKKTKWQIGPQVRYQLLSSFISKYPVKENLFDFGLKLGVSLNKP